MKIKILSFLSLCLLAFSSLAIISPPPPDAVFIPSAKLTDDSTIEIEWEIKPGFYLYKEKIYFNVEPDIAIHPSEMPEAIVLNNPVLGNEAVYANQLLLTLKLFAPIKDALTLQVTYQGCAESGFCYPPIHKSFTLTPSMAASNISDTTSTNALFNKSTVLVLLGFLGLGLLLSLTPCIFPMIPILSGIILGQKNLSTLKAFSLSCAYVLGMAITYAITGIIAGLAGSHLQSALQTPIALSFASAVLILLALSLFGMYQIQLPLHWREKIAAWSEKQPRGHHFGVFIMGGLASLIISPCITPPLIGALTYIGHTGNAAIGGGALFMLGIGMGIPLIVIGTAGGKVFPKAGQWMNVIKNLFGVALIIMAIELVTRFIPSYFSMLLWGIAAITLGIYLGAFRPFHTINWRLFLQGIGLTFVIYGSTLIIGATMGNTSLLKPLHVSSVTVNHSETSAPFFHTVTNVKALEKELHHAKKEGKPVFIDFYADWCLSCKKMAATIFVDEQVKSALISYHRIKADVTANNEETKALMEKMYVIAPPTFLFFSPSGKEMVEYRLVGGISTENFLKHLEKIRNG